MSIVRRGERIARCNRYGRDQATLAVLPIRERAERKLEFGADGYVTKPCSPGEVLARVRTVMRRLIYSRSNCVQRRSLLNYIAKIWTMQSMLISRDVQVITSSLSAVSLPSECCSGLHGTD